MKRTTRTVRIPARPEAAYEVYIGAGLLGRVADEVGALLPGRRPFVVTDANVQRAGHLATFAGDAEVDAFVIDPPGEPSKTLATATAIVGEMERRRFGRDTVVLALGGGTVGDIGGFAAAVFKRGVSCVQVPTTTVAQADSAIGGKTGVDSEWSKNAYGAFHHPAAVYVDVRTLRTLDERHYRAGLVESVKHAMIADAAYFDYLAAHVDDLLRRDEPVLMHLGERNTAIKGRTVFADPEEQGLRRILNFGHTLGHAMESASGYALLHGEAVAVGMIAACRIGERLGICPAAVTRRAEVLLERLDVPRRIPADIDAAALREAMSRDKKAVGRAPRFVLLVGMGEVHVGDGAHAAPVPAEIVDAVINEMTGAGG